MGGLLEELSEPEEAMNPKNKKGRQGDLGAKRRS
jgi:hypothetical protein